MASFLQKFAAGASGTASSLMAQDYLLNKKSELTAKRDEVLQGYSKELKTMDKDSPSNQVAQMKLDAAKQMESLTQAYMAAETEEEKLGIAEKIKVLNGDVGKTGSALDDTRIVMSAIDNAVQQYTSQSVNGRYRGEGTLGDLVQGQLTMFNDSLAAQRGRSRSPAPAPDPVNIEFGTPEYARANPGETVGTFKGKPVTFGQLMKSLENGNIESIAEGLKRLEPLDE